MVRAGLPFIAAMLVVGWTPHPASAATCSDYSNQADAQRAQDTRDADGDGIYCESLPCPCLKPGENGGGSNPSPAPSPKPKASCTRPQDVQRIRFSRAKYPTIRLHSIQAVGRGWPRVMVLNRKGADARRDRLLDAFPTRPALTATSTPQR